MFINCSQVKILAWCTDTVYARGEHKREVLPVKRNQVLTATAAVCMAACLAAGCKENEHIPQVPFPVNTEDSEAPDLQIQASEPEFNTYDTLNVATYLTKIGDTYFLSDCYHNQILYHDNLTDALTQWQVLTDEVHYAHTIAGNGKVLLVDDTENNRLLVFCVAENGYVHTQTFENTGMKPHYVQYNADREEFFAWSSITGEMFYLKRDKNSNELYIDKKLQIPELYGIYVRSFTIMGDDIYFVSGHNNRKIIKADADTLEIEESYEVPPAIAGMVQLTRIQDYYYITVSTDDKENQDYATIVRTKSLEDLAAGNYEDIYAGFGLSGGTPYYITQIDGRYYMTHHRTADNIIAFDVKDNEICNVQVIY